MKTNSDENETDKDNYYDTDSKQNNVKYVDNTDQNINSDINQLSSYRENQSSSDNKIDDYRYAVECCHNDLTKYKELALINIMRYVKCQLLVSGYKTVVADYIFCKTCDSEEKYAVCLECSKTCHENHKLTSPVKIAAICSCGIACHKSQSINQDIGNTNKCPFDEWFVTSGLNIVYTDNQKRTEMFNTINDNNQNNDDESNLVNIKLDKNDIDEFSKVNTLCFFCANFCNNHSKLEKIVRNRPYTTEFDQYSNSNKDGININNINNNRIPNNPTPSFPKCSCNNPIHKEKTNVIRKFNEIVRIDDYDFHNLIETQIINTIFLSPLSFKYFFGGLSKFIKELNSELDNPNIVLDSSNITSGLSWSLQNLCSLQLISKDLFYFTEEVNCLFDSTFVFNLLKKKFDLKSIPVWSTFSQVIQIYYKLYFEKEFSMIPDLNINDLMNFHPLLRLMISRNIFAYSNITSFLYENIHVDANNINNNSNSNFINNSNDVSINNSNINASNIKDITNNNNNIYNNNLNHKSNINNNSTNYLLSIHHIIKLLTVFKNNHIDNIYCYNILLNLYKMVLFYAKFNLIPFDIVVGFCTLNDDYLYKFLGSSKANMQDIEMYSMICQLQISVVAVISQILLYLTFLHNDTQVENCFFSNADYYNAIWNDTSNKESIYFFHSQMKSNTQYQEVCRLINKNTINISNFFRINQYYEKSSNMKTIFNCLHIIQSLSLETFSESYIEGVRQLLISKANLFLKFIDNDVYFDPKVSSISSINSTGKSIYSINSNSMNNINNNINFNSHSSNVINNLKNSNMYVNNEANLQKDNIDKSELNDELNIENKDNLLVHNNSNINNSNNKAIRSKKRRASTKRSIVSTATNKTLHSNKNPLMTSITKNSRHYKFNKLSDLEKQFLNYLILEVNQLESAIEKYFKFSLSRTELQRLFLNSITSLFNKLGISDFSIPNFEDIFEKKNSIILFEENNDQEKAYESPNKNNASENVNSKTEFSGLPEEVVKILLNKTYYIFTIFKVVKIIIQSHRKEFKFSLITPEIDLDKTLLDSLLKLMYYYIENFHENLIIACSSYFTNIVNIIPKSHLLPFISMYIYIMGTILNLNINLVKIDNIIELIENLIRKLKDSDYDLLKSIINFIDVLKDVSVIDNSVPEKLRNIIKLLTRYHSLFLSFKDFLINNMEFKDYYCYNNEIEEEADAEKEANNDNYNKKKNNNEDVLHFNIPIPDDNDKKSKSVDIQQSRHVKNISSIKNINNTKHRKVGSVIIKLNQGKQIEVVRNKKSVISRNYSIMPSHIAKRLSQVTQLVKLFKKSNKNEISQNNSNSNLENNSNDNVHNTSNNKDKDINDLIVNKTILDNNDNTNNNKAFNLKTTVNKSNKLINSVSKLKKLKSKYSNLSISNSLLNNASENNQLSPELLSFTYIIFLKIVNKLFDQDSTFNETKFLSSIISQEEMVLIMQNINLSLVFRVQLLIFFRMSYIDIITSKEKIRDYRTLIINPIIIENQSSALSNYAEDASLYAFLKNLMSVNNTLENFKSEIAIIKNEMSRFDDILFYSQTYDTDSIIAYFEDGIIKPIHVFITKFMSVIYLLNGYAMIDLYELVVYFLRMKLFLLTNIELFNCDSNGIINKDSMLSYREGNNNSNKNGNDNDDKEKMLFNSKFFKSKNMLGSIFKLEMSYLNQTKRDIEIMTKEDFEVFNYQLVYYYYNKHLQDFVTKPELITMLNNFNKNTDNVNIKTNYLQSNYDTLSLINKKLLYLLIKYERDKQSLGNSTFIQTLDEQNIMHRSSYRYLFMKTLFFLSTNENFKGKYTKQAFWNIFRLLHHDTSQTQAEILKLYKKDPKLINFEYIENYFVENFLSLVFSNSNPTSTPDRNDYFQAMTIIKILKYLCEEHNQYFQTVFFSVLKYEFVKNTDSDLNFTKSINSNENVETIETINLFDYTMCILSKIVVLTQWTKAKYDSEEKELAYYYDIYFVVVELLIEIIQGTSKANLETLLKVNNTYGGKVNNEERSKNCNKVTNNLSKNNNADNNIQRSLDNNYLLSCLNELKQLLFYDKTNSKVIYKARLAAINFILAFLEEPNTPLNVINNISHVYTPNLIFESIAIIMKKLYIRLKNENGESSTILINNSNSIEDEKNSKEKRRTGGIHHTKSLADNSHKESSHNTKELHKENYNKNKNDYSNIMNTDTISLLKNANDNKDKVVNESQHNLIIFNHKLSSFFTYEFFENPNFAEENPEFELCNRLYQYVFLLQKEFKNEEAINIFNTVDMYKSAENELNSINYQKMSKKENKKQDKDKDLSEDYDLNKGNYDNDDILIENIDISLKLDNINDFISITNQNRNKFKNKEIIIDQQFYEIYYLIQFFNRITRSVTVSKAGEKARVVYTLNPLSEHLSVNTMNDFYLNVDRSNRYTKLFNLNENINYFYEEVLYNEKNLKGNFLFQILNKFDYKSYEKYLFLLTLIVNILNVASLHNTTVYPGLSTGENNIVPRNPTIQIYYDSSIIENLVLVCFILIILLNGLGVLFWLITKYPLYFKIEKIKYLKRNSYQNNSEDVQEEDNNNNVNTDVDYEDDLTCMKNFYILLNTIYYKSEINGLIINIICSMLSQLVFPYLTFFYAIQMLMIINMNDSMKNIQRAVSMRSKQLIAIGIFSIIIFDVFGNVGYFWLKTFYNKTIVVTGYDLEENLCSTLVYCFLTNLRYGFLTEGGIGEFINKTYYEPGNTIFAGLFFNNLLFFLFIKVAMLYISLSLVIDTYAELREESYKLETDKNDICFICGATRDQLEKDNIRFDNHTKEDHDMWEYAIYLIGLKFVDIQDTNAINSYVMEKLQTKSIAWYPYYQGEGDNEDNEEEEEDE